MHWTAIAIGYGVVIPKLHTRIRFPSPAPALCLRSAKSTTAPA